jgi:hypothetical protein
MQFIILFSNFICVYTALNLHVILDYNWMEVYLITMKLIIIDKNLK